MTEEYCSRQNARFPRKIDFSGYFQGPGVKFLPRGPGYCRNEILAGEYCRNDLGNFCTLLLLKCDQAYCSNRFSGTGGIVRLSWGTGVLYFW